MLYKVPIGIEGNVFGICFLCEKENGIDGQKRGMMIFGNLTFDFGSDYCIFIIVIVISYIKHYFLLEKNKRRY